VERPVLALAALGPAHVLLLEDDRLSVWRLTPSALVHEGEVMGPAAERVRWPGGLIHAPAGEDSAWVLRSGWAEALLVGREDGGGGLAIRSPAVALPWTGAPPGGVRFRAGTSLVEGRMEGLGDGPYLALAPEGGAAVDADGRLRIAPALDGGDETIRVGSAVAHPWPDVVVASSPSPAAPDALVIVRVGGGGLRLEGSVPIDGRVRALVSLTTPATATLLVAVEDGAGSRIVRVEIPRAALDHR
jgi:hypothetical protein